MSTGSACCRRSDRSGSTCIVTPGARAIVTRRAGDVGVDAVHATEQEPSAWMIETLVRRFDDVAVRSVGAEARSPTPSRAAGERRVARAIPGAASTSRRKSTALRGKNARRARQDPAVAGVAVVALARRAAMIDAARCSGARRRARWATRGSRRGDARWRRFRRSSSKRVGIEAESNALDLVDAGELPAHERASARRARDLDGVRDGEGLVPRMSRRRVVARADGAAPLPAQ